MGNYDFRDIQNRPIQQFIHHIEHYRTSAAGHVAKATYWAIIEIARKHQQTYGDNAVGELINYLNEFAEHPDLNRQARHIVKLMAEGLKTRWLARKAKEQAS